VENSLRHASISFVPGILAGHIGRLNPPAARVRRATAVPRPAVPRSQDAVRDAVRRCDNGRAMTARVRVLVADDHPLFREGVARAIRDRPDLELVAEAADGAAALEQTFLLTPDVALLDVRLPGLDGPSVLKALRRAGDATPVLFLSAFTDGDVVHPALSAGAAGYLSKEATRDEICDAIAAVARGETVLSREAQAGVIRALHHRGSAADAVLTPREREVLTLTASGISAPEIGRRLYLSPATVKTHLGRTYEKLGVDDRAAAVAEAIRRGLIS
jgi:two-component system nitrate/nitrite response regulator NarL